MSQLDHKYVDVFITSTVNKLIYCESSRRFTFRQDKGNQMLSFKRIDSKDNVVGVWLNDGTIEPHIIMTMRDDKAILSFKKDADVPIQMMNKLAIAVAAFESACNKHSQRTVNAPI